MKRYLLLLLLLFPFIVKAKICTSDEYYLYIENDNITVKACNEVISDYSNIVEYNNRVLTVKEGAYINCIYFNDIDLIVTSNNKVAYIGYINHGNYSTNINVHKTLTIRDYKNDENTPWRLYVDVKYSKIVAENCEIYNLDSLRNDEYWKNAEAGLTAKNSKFVGGTLFTAGPIILENVEHDASYIQSEDSYLIIKNSTLNMNGNLYNDGGDGRIEIYDSTINFVGKYGQISVYNHSDVREKDYSLIIKNTTVNGGGLYASTRNDLPVYIENSNMISTISEVSGPIFIKDSNIKMNFKDTYGGTNLHGMSVINSTIETNKNIQNNEGINTIIKDSVLKVGTNYSDYNETNISSSSIEAGIMILFENAAVNNSTVKVIYPSGLTNRYSGAFNIRKKLSLNKSYIYLESNDNDVVAFKIIGQEGSFEYDDDLVVTDKNGVELKLVYKDGTGYSYYYDNDGNNISNSVTLRAKANVTFKIVNGAWADGSINDIVITKDVWDKLNEDEIPSIEGLPNGHWEIVPSTEDYIKGDVTYVYVIDEVKGVEENPKTGVSNIFTIISLILAITLTVIYNKHLNKSYFMKG